MRQTATVLALAAAIAALLGTGPAAAQDASRIATDAPRAAPGVRHRIEPNSFERAPRAEAGTAVPRPVIGIVLAQDSDQGVAIAAVTPGSAAADAGLRTGDVVVAIDGHDLLGSTGDLRVVNAHRLMSDLDTGKPVRLDYLRDGKRLDVQVTPRLSDRVVVWVDDSGREISTHGDVVVMTREAVRRLRDIPGVPGIAPDIRREVDRLVDAPMLLEAFRWNGLNLATVGTELGRYFGTTKGVLVLSAGPRLAGLQPGDVIRKVGKTSVDTPREAMDALRRLEPGSKVTLDVLRDRKADRVTIVVPKTLPGLPAAPPPPPTPPAPGMPAPPAPPAPPPPPRPGGY